MDRLATYSGFLRGFASLNESTFPAVNAPVLRSPARRGAGGRRRPRRSWRSSKSLSPEFRTTGDFRPTLRDFADKLSELAASIRNTTLARTIYTEADFGKAVPDYRLLRQ